MSNRDKVIDAAKECGYWSGQTIEMNDVGIERFYTIAHDDGRQAEREECAQLREQVKLLRDLLVRYRTEVRPGFQPHMICHKVDEALAATEPKKDGK